MTRNHCVLLLAVLTLTACGSKPEEPVVAPKPKAALQRELAALKDPTSKMARAVSGKPGAAVELKYDIASKPAPGVATEVKLALIPGVPAERLKLKITGMEGLTLSGSLEDTIENPQTGQVYEHRFSLLPDRAGIYYASVTVITETAGSQMGRTYSVPLLVGDVQAAQKPAAAPPKDAKGQAIESMKAAEGKG